MKHHRIFAALVALVAINMFPKRADALVIVPQSLRGIPISTRFDQSAREDIRKALMSANEQYLGGYAVNAITHLRFAGDTQDLNRLIRKSHECPYVSTGVRFQELDIKCDWKVIYNASAMTVEVIVNRNSKSIQFDEAVLPWLYGPALPLDPVVLHPEVSF